MESSLPITQVLGSRALLPPRGLTAELVEQNLGGHVGDRLRLVDLVAHAIARVVKPLRRRMQREPEAVEDLEAARLDCLARGRVDCLQMVRVDGEPPVRVSRTEGKRLEREGSSVRRGMHTRSVGTQFESSRASAAFVCAKPWRSPLSELAVIRALPRSRGGCELEDGAKGWLGATTLAPHA